MYIIQYSTVQYSSTAVQQQSLTKFRVTFHTNALRLRAQEIARQAKQEMKGKGKLHSLSTFDSLCGLVVRVPGYRSRGPGFNSDFLISSEYRTGYIQPHEDNRGDKNERKNSGSGLETLRLTAVGIHRTDQTTLSFCKIRH
jgi:hypothetical protein